MHKYRKEIVGEKKQEQAELNRALRNLKYGYRRELVSKGKEEQRAGV